MKAIGVSVWLELLLTTVWEFCPQLMLFVFSSIYLVWICLTKSKHAETPSLLRTSTSFQWLCSHRPGKSSPPHAKLSGCITPPILRQCLQGCPRDMRFRAWTTFIHVISSTGAPCTPKCGAWRHYKYWANRPWCQPGPWRLPRLHFAPVDFQWFFEAEVGKC